MVGDLAALAADPGLSDPLGLAGEVLGPGGPRDRGAVLLRAEGAVLLESCEVATMDAVRAGRLGGQVVYMTLAGRVNKRAERASVGFMFGPDGAAAIITELLALADRFGAELLDDVTRRLTELWQEKAVDLHFLRAAIDNAIDASEPGRL